MKKLIIASMIIVFSLSATISRAGEMETVDNYLPSLITTTPYEGRLLAIKVVRKTIGAIQTDAEAKNRVRAKYAEDPSLLMNAAELVAIEFKTIAIANDYWRN